MTMVVIHAGDRSADVVTDSLQYSPGGRFVEDDAVKAVVTPRHGFALVSQGDAGFMGRWLDPAVEIDARVDDVEGFAAEFGCLLPEAWERCTGTVEIPAQLADSIAFVVGFSPGAGRYRAFGFSSLDGFRPAELDGLYAMPAPTDARPGAFELAAYQRAHVALGVAPDASAASVAHWASQAPLTAPTDRAGWVALTKHIHAARAIPVAGKVFIGGDIIRIRLTVDAPPAFDTIHTFPMYGPEWDRMVAGTLHPDGQRGPCPCGSGGTFLDCCLATVADQPCGCASGVPFDECCRVGT